jgi:hypothetical protein
MEEAFKKLGKLFLGRMQSFPANQSPKDLNQKIILT